MARCSPGSNAKSLKGLAHPLRAQLLESLSALGPATASMLGERTPAGLTLNVTDFEPDSPARLAAVAVEREWERSRAGLLDDFTRRGPIEVTKDWYDATAINTINMRLTRQQLTEFVAEVEAVFERWVTTHKEETPGSRPVQAHFNAFPVLGGNVSGAE